MQDAIKLAARNLIIVLVLFAIGILTVYGFSVLQINTHIGLLVFTLGILIAVLETDRAVWGGVLGVAYLLCFDYLYVEPLYELKVFSYTDIIALVIFAAVSIIMSSIARRMSKQVEIAERNALIMERLNKVSTGLIDSTSKEEVREHIESLLRKFLKREVNVTLGPPDENANRAELTCFEENTATGAGVAGWKGYLIKYLPLGSRESIYGIVELDCSEGDLDEAGREFLRSVITQAVIAIERNELEDEKRESKIRMERERFEASLLRSVSHDLRTPLTSISGNTAFLLNNPNTDAATRTELLQAVSDDASWLNSMVDNLLGMTRIQDTDAPLQKSSEVLDEIIGYAVSRERSRIGGHKLLTKTADDFLMVPMNAKLISQVIINLINNAITHSDPNSTIVVSSWSDDRWAHVAVSDNGGGIDPKELKSIFRKFYTTGQPTQGRQGMGLGLSICEAIVKAHGGGIRAYNNKQGGATFEFTLPLESTLESIEAEEGERP